MLKIDRGAYFAIGLVVGVALALLIFIWTFPWFGDPRQVASYCQPNDQLCAEQYQNAKDSHFWVRPFYGWIYAEDTLAQWGMALFSFFATLASVWAVILLRRTLFAEIQPHLTVLSCDNDIELSAEGFLRNKVQTHTPFFEIVNAGRSGAIITGLYRAWHVCKTDDVPPAIVYPDRPVPTFYKPNHIPVGPGGRSPSVKGRLYDIAFPIGTNDIIYFYGYIEFSDLAGDRYVSGFSLVFDEGRFHTAWPPQNAEKYNYQRKLT